MKKDRLIKTLLSKNKRSKKQIKEFELKQVMYSELKLDDEDAKTYEAICKVLNFVEKNYKLRK